MDERTSDVKDINRRWLLLVVRAMPEFLCQPQNTCGLSEATQTDQRPSRVGEE